MMLHTPEEWPAKEIKRPQLLLHVAGRVCVMGPSALTDRYLFTYSAFEDPGIQSLWFITAGTCLSQHSL